MKVFELRKKRAELAAEARKIVELATSENRDNTDEEKVLIEGRMAEIATVDRQIVVLERIETIESQGGLSLDRRGDLPDLNGPKPYSLLRAYRCALGIERGGLEVEVGQELAVRAGKTAQGMFIPWNLGAEQRTLNAATTGVGAIPAILGTELIVMLRNKSVMAAMGARIMVDMQGGTFSLPKQTGTTTGYWVAEGTAPTASNLTLAQVVWTPRTLGAFTDLTRKFILQTNQDAEALARDDLTRMLAVELDRVAINGAGVGQEPKGILQDSNVPTVALGTNGLAPTWASVLALEKNVATANAEFGKLGYITSNAGRSTLKSTPKAGSFPVFIWENAVSGDMATAGQGIVNGYRAMATEQVPSNLTKGTSTGVCSAMIYGNFDSATYALWSGIDVLVDPYTGSSAGTVRIVALQDVDVQYRWEVGFSKMLDMLTT